MSNPTRTQQRFPFRTSVRVQRNNPRLPPITTPIRPLEQQEDEPIPSALSFSKIEVKCETPPIQSKDFWVRVHEDIAKERLENFNERGNQNTPNKVVRIFVSSTFTDFFNEREILIKKVFTALRDEMEPAGIQIIDCDLRWGVPKDSTTEQTILACLEELDRCFEDNGQPFFIGLISDKYGWVPKLNELPKNITERYRWIDGASITLMEFIHGAFRTNNPNAFFLIRKSENILKNLPEKYNDKFRDKDELSQNQIKELKRQLTDFIPPEQVFAYDCFYNGLDSSTGRERVRIDGLHEFEEQTKNFLIQAIRKWYPENFVEESSGNSEQKHMRIFLLNKTQLYIDQTSEFAALLAYITGAHDDLKLLDGQPENELNENDQPLIGVTGVSGSGKTMLLAKLALYIEEEMKDKCLLFYYFTEGAFHVDPTEFMKNDLKQKFETYLNNYDIKSPKTGDRLKITDEKFLQEAITLISIPIIIIVDGLDKGDLHQERKYGTKFPFCNLPELFSDHTYIIISAETDSSLQKLINRYSHYQVELKSLSNEQRRAYIEMFFQRFNKILEPEQKSLLVNNKGGEHPLYLSYVCENLRQFGDYSLVTKRLQTYPQTTDELLDVLLNEIYTLIDNQSLIDAFFKLLIISNIGLLESDIVNMLQLYMNKITDENTPVVVNQMAWSLLRRHMKTFLDTTWIEGHQLITFHHPSLEQKLRHRCLKDNTNDIRSLNGFLAEFYRKESSIKDFASRRVPYHYDQGSMWKELITYLRSLESRYVSRTDRCTYLRKRRCTKVLHGNDGILNQRAYVCNICAMQFKLGPYTMTKSSCLICANMIVGGNMNDPHAARREARFCQKHGHMGYPNSYQCAICKMQRQLTKTSPSAIDSPVPMSICSDCWIHGGASATRCCALECD